MKYCILVDTSLTSLQPWRNENSSFYKKKHEALLLTGILVEETHKDRLGSKERGTALATIAEHLNSQESGTKVTKRSVGEKFDKLYQDFQKREREESRASGVDVECDEIYQALIDINDHIVNWEEQEIEQATAEEMR